MRSPSEIKILHLIPGLVLLGFTSRLCSCLQLDTDGGYHVQISIKSETLDPVSSEDFIERLKEHTTVLAKSIFETTDKQFHIKTVSILVPETWTHSSSEIEISTRQSYSTADIKISDDILTPNVIRPTQCFLAGDEIKLPSSILQDSNDRAKLLLRLWAEYRWGVFDESGFSGNSRFPYLYKNYETAEWEVSSCFNDEVTGSYKIPETGDPCAVDNIGVTPNEACRFVPDENGNDNIKSSLMNSFYEMPSINSFCTDETHNIRHPTRHNVYCGYRSVKSVTMESLDWKSVTEAVTTLPTPVFSLIKTSTTPLAYYLIDSRVIPIPFAVVQTIRENLGGLFGSDRTDNIISAFGKFPGSGGEFEEVIPWTLMKDARTEFQEALATTISSGSASGNGDFPSALKEIALSIQSKNHDGGAYIFVFKGSPISDFSESPFEEELISIIRNAKIKIYAVELKSSSFDTGENLINLATESKGSHSVLVNDSSIDDLPSFITEFVSETLSPDFEPSNTSTIFMELISSVSPFTLNLPSGATGPLKIHLTAENLNSSNSELFINDESIGFKTEVEYHESSSKGKRVTLVGEHNAPQTGDVFSVNFNCESDDCQALLVITEDKSSDPNDPADPVLSISTSAKSNTYNEIEQPRGLGVFVKVKTGVEFNYQDIEGTASICLKDNPLKCWKVLLNDNGGGAPDLVEGDGIISGTFVPSEIGSYNIRANVRFMRETSSPNSNNDLKVSTGIMKVVEYPNFVEVTELPNPVAEPSRVVNLMLKEAAENIAKLTWNAPAVNKAEGPVAAESYELRDCDSAAQVISDIANCNLLPIGDMIPGDPAQPQELTITLPDDDLLHFISLQSNYEGTLSEPSNFIAFQKQDPPPTEPTVPSPPTTEPTVPSPPTTEPSSPQTEPSSPTTESSSPQTEPSPPQTEPSPPTTEPSSPQTEPSSPTTEPSSPTTEPSSPTTEPSSPTTEQTTPETDSPATDPSTPENDQSTPETDSPATDSSTPETSSSSPVTDPESEPTTPTPTTIPSSSSQPTPTTLVPPVTPEESVYFFKRPEGYATIGGIVLVAVLGVGGALGYLIWKRNMLIKAGKLH